MSSLQISELIGVLASFLSEAKVQRDVDNHSSSDTQYGQLSVNEDKRGEERKSCITQNAD